MGHNGCDGSQASGPWAIGSGYCFTDRSSFFPCILHIMMICGKLVLSSTRKVALDLSNDRVRLLKATFKAANIRWRGLHKESAPDGQEVQRLLCAWDTVPHVLSIQRSAEGQLVKPWYSPFGSR